MVISVAKGTVARGVVAWVGACLVAGYGMILVIGVALLFTGEAADLSEFRVYEIAGEAVALGLGLSGFAAMVTSLPVIWLLTIIQHFEIPRGWSDAFIGGIPGYIALIALTVHAFAPGYPDSGEAFFVLMFLLPGWAAGLTYWLLAGRPRPPY